MKNYIENNHVVKYLIALICLSFLCSLSLPTLGQDNSKDGSLFIIGGGDRPGYLIKEMLTTANLSTDDYVVILPMANSDPMRGIDGIRKQIEEYSNNRIAGLNFGKGSVNKQAWVDSVANARLIYIVGGSQRRFMNLVRGTPVHTSIQKAFKNGAMIAGTSAGAAVMSEVMITGRQKQDKEYQDFKNIWFDNVETVEGLGLLPSNTIIDQHFIKRSRQNRLISVLADFPEYKLIGIDESTAIIANGKHAKVVGEGQVMVMSEPRGLSKSSGKLVTFKDIHLSLLSSGDTIKLK